MSIRSDGTLPDGPEQCNLDAELSLSLDRTAEILRDMEAVVLQYGPDSEPWKFLLKDLQEQERRTSDLGRQLDACHDQRLEADPSMTRLTTRGDALINRLLAFSEGRP